VIRGPYKGNNDVSEGGGMIRVRGFGKRGGWSSVRFGIADKEDRESDTIRKVRVRRRFKMVSRQSKMACSSVVSVGACCVCFTCSVVCFRSIGKT